MVVEESVVQHDALYSRSRVFRQAVGSSLRRSHDAIGFHIGTISVERPGHWVRRMCASQPGQVVVLGLAHEAPGHQRGHERLLFASDGLDAGAGAFEALTNLVGRPPDRVELVCPAPTSRRIHGPTRVPPRMIGGLGRCTLLGKSSARSNE